jgi:hypothetical protein
MADGHIHDLAEASRRIAAAPSPRAAQVSLPSNVRRARCVSIDGRLARIGLMSADGSVSQEIDGCAVWGDAMPAAGDEGLALFEGERPVPFFIPA